MPPKLTREDEEKLDRLLSGFTANLLPKPRITLWYRLGLCAVAVGMVLLPVFYVALVLLFATWTLSHAIHPPELWEYWAWCKYAVIVVAGPIAVFFMVKPLFAPAVRNRSTIRVSHKDEPLLNEFVRRVARTVGAPVPKRIELDCSVNAAAAYAGGFRAVWSNQLKLVIGLPLVAGLSLRAFGGVLAHEFGHFSQAAGMRMTYVIRRVNNWFYCVVYERDAWDLKLRDSTANEKGLTALLAYAALGVITLTRAILWVFMIIGHGISCFALRQMEFDADAYEVQFAGSDAFDKTTRRISVLHAGSAQALRLIEENWQEQRLAEDFPTLARSQADSLSRKVLDAIEESMEEARTSAFATHPTDIDRIRAAQKRNAEGIFCIDEPATGLFMQFDSLARKASARFYRDDLGLQFSESCLVDNTVLDRESRARKNESEACERFFGGKLSVIRPLYVTPEEFSDFCADRVFGKDSLLKAISQVNIELSASERYFDDFEEADDAAVLAMQARELLMAAYRVEASRFGLTRGDLGDAQRVRDDAQIRRNAALVHLQPFDKAAKYRLMTGLALLKQREAETHCGDGDEAYMARECERFLEVLGLFGSIRTELVQLRDRWMAQAALINTLTPDGASESVIKRLQANAVEFGPLELAIRSRLEKIDYPFKHSRGEVSIAEYVQHHVDEHIDVSLRTFATAEKMLERLFTLYFRVMGRLVILAETVEMGEWIAEGMKDEGGGE